jgi:hypothetical protein
MKNMNIAELRAFLIKGPQLNSAKGIEEKVILGLFNGCYKYNHTLDRGQYIKNLILTIHEHFTHILTPEHLNAQCEQLGRSSTPLHQIANYLPSGIPKKVITNELKELVDYSDNTLAHKVNPTKNTSALITWKFCNPKSIEIQNSRGCLPIQEWSIHFNRHFNLQTILDSIPAPLFKIESLTHKNDMQESLIDTNIKSLKHTQPITWVKLSKTNTDLQDLITYLQTQKESSDIIKNLTDAQKLKNKIKDKGSQIKAAIEIIPELT